MRDDESKHICKCGKEEREGGRERKTQGWKEREKYSGAHKAARVRVRHKSRAGEP